MDKAVDLLFCDLDSDLRKLVQFENQKKICLRQGSNQGPSAPYPTALSITPRGRNENFDEKKKFC